MSFAVIDHQQGSIPWLRWRHDGIGSSDAPALLGENPFRSAARLFAEKAAPSRFGGASSSPVRAPAAQQGQLFGGDRGFASAALPSPPPDLRHRSAAARGSALEPYARALYNRHIGGLLQPDCLQSIERPWQRASLDGIDLAARRAVEIKCGDKAYALTKSNNAVPSYYIGQLQHILAVSGYDAIDFWVWLPGKTPLLLTVPRDEAYIARMIALEAKFWEAVMTARSASAAVRAGK